MNFDNFNSADWQNFSYLSLLLVILATSLVTRREFSFGKIVKYLGIWTIIAITLIVLYSYRYEFSDFKNRVAGEVNPAEARVTKNNQIIIRAAEDGHFYVNAKINESVIRFMIDTGASDIAISLNDAERIGIKTKNLIFNKRYQTANGVAFGAGINLEELEIAGARFINLPASINGGNMGASLLGMSFLKQLKKYEVYQDKLVLTIS